MHDILTDCTSHQKFTAGVFGRFPDGQAQGSKCPSLPDLTHWENPGLPGLGFKPFLKSGE